MNECYVAASMKTFHERPLFLMTIFSMWPFKMLVLGDNFYLKLIGLYHHHRLTKMLSYWSSNGPFTAVISPTVASAIARAIVILLHSGIVIVKQIGFVTTFVILSNPKI